MVEELLGSLLGGETTEKKAISGATVSKIADQEDFEVTDEEIKQQLEDMAKQYGLEVEKLTEMIGAENIT